MLLSRVPKGYEEENEDMVIDDEDEWILIVRWFDLDWRTEKYYIVACNCNSTSILTHC